MNNSVIPGHIHCGDVYKCSGKFCGRSVNSTNCGACTWGSRILDSNSLGLSDICQICFSPPTLHGWLYLGFVAILPILFGFSVLFDFTRNFSVKPKNVPSHWQNTVLPFHPISKLNLTIVQKSLFVCFLNIIIHLSSAFIALFIFPPLGTLSLFACHINAVGDFYAPILAAPGCSYEVAFPFLSLPLFYCALSALISILAYWFLFNCIFQDRSWLKLLYYALYAYPALCFILIVFGGILYSTYPYVLLVLALLDSIHRFPAIFDDCIKYPDQEIRPVCHPLILIKQLLSHPGSFCFPLTVNFMLTSYALVAYSQCFHWTLCFSLFPFLFYVFTLPLSHPFLYYDGEEILNAMNTKCLLDSPAVDHQTIAHNGSHFAQCNNFRTSRNTFS